MDSSIGLIRDIESVLKDCNQTTLKFHGFSILYNGVLSILFEGFHPQCEEMKKKIESHPSFSNLKPEFGGSKFPKVSIGVRKTAENFTLVQIKKLLSICETFSKELDFSVPVENLFYVKFQKRSLEPPRDVVKISLSEKKEEKYAVSELSSKIVEIIDRSFETNESITEGLKNINTDQGLIERYREMLESPDETLVLFIYDLLEEDVRNRILEFEREVKKEFPFYEFFDCKSWHVTFRALEMKEKEKV